MNFTHNKRGIIHNGLSPLDNLKFRKNYVLLEEMNKVQLKDIVTYADTLLNCCFLTEFDRSNRTLYNFTPS